MNHIIPKFVPPKAWPPELGLVHEACHSLFESGEWAQYPGKRVEQLEQRLARETARKHCITCCSGTAAVELALRAVGVKAGDEVILSAYDYPGNFRSISALGAEPRGVDVSPDRWTLNPACVADAISDRTRAVLMSHLHGLMADVPGVESLVAQRGIVVIEDACQALGGSMNQRPVGSFGGVSVLSFGGSKLVTAGNGGAILTDDDRWAQRLRVFNERPARAFALSELQAAMLVPQLDRLPQRHQERRNQVARLRAIVAQATDWQLATEQTVDSDAGDYKCAWFVREAKRDQVIALAQEAELPLGAGFAVFRRIASTPIEHAKRAGKELVVLDHRALHPQSNVFDILGAIHQSLK